MVQNLTPLIELPVRYGISVLQINYKCKPISSIICNKEAGKQSRICDDVTEWKLKSELFKRISGKTCES